MLESTTLRFSPKTPFRFAQTLDFIRTFRSNPNERLHADKQIVNGALQRITSVGGVPVLFWVRDMGGAAGPCLELTVCAERLTSALKAATLDRARFLISADDDLTPFYKLGHSDQAFKGVIRALYGYHPYKLLTPFEAACWALIQQRTPNAFAHKTMQRLSERYGSRLEHKHVVHHAFPEAQQLVGVSPEGILWATNNTRKTERMVQLVRAFASADETFLHTAPYDEVAAWLRGIKGIGTWSVDFIMLRGLGRYERAPWSDTGLLEAVSDVYTQGFTISARGARELAEHYGWHQGLWAHYLKTYYWGKRRALLAS